MGWIGKEAPNYDIELANPPTAYRIDADPAGSCD